MIKSVVIFGVFLACFASTNAKEDGDFYTDQYDSIDIDEILRSERLIKNYVFCLLDKGNCPPAARELRKNIPEVLKNNCEKCSPIQRQLGEKVVKHLYEKKKDWWTELEKKYDEAGEYKKRYEADLHKVLETKYD